MKVDFRGAGGSSGGGSKFTTSPDNLRSNDTFEGLIGLCVGPIKGPVNGMQSVRINQTPIEDTTGKDNFPNFAANFADGDPLKFPQIVTLRLGAAGAPDSINTQLRNIGGTNPQWSTHTLNQTGASHIDLRFVVNELYRQDKTGIYDTTANILIQMKPVGTLTWINPFDGNGNTLPSYDPTGYDYESYPGKGAIKLYTTPTAHTTASTHPSTLTITGKTTSTYVKELRINVPNTGVYANVGWDVRCQLQQNEDLEADPNVEKRNISWESATAVYANTLGSDEEWRAFSWLQLYGKASDSFSGVPDVEGVYDTKIVSVPPSSVYNPDTRQYTGAIWDGSWAKAFTSDPAWILNDAITDSISGLARLVPGAYLNKWDALELSKYASELVSNGSGGQEPRFSLNLAIDQPQRSDDFIRYLAGACGATAWDNGNGEWRMALDRPKNPTALYTYENIEGEFNYSHTDIDTRYNEVTVTFLNEEFDYRQDQLKISDPDHIAKFGRKPTSVVAIGCTNRRQALRWAILKMRTNINEFRSVSYTTNRQGKMLERFGWVLIADQSLNMTADDTKRTTGRVVQNNGTSVVLRDTVRLETGITYQLHFTAPNPSYNPDTTTAPTDPDWQAPTLTYTRTLMNNAAQRGDVKELFIDSPLPGNVAANVNVALDCPGLPSVPKVYRVLDLDYSDDGERVTVSAIEVDTGKYTASDTADYTYVEPGYAAPGADIPMPLAPTDGVLKLQSFSGDTTTTNYITVNWQRPSYPLLKGYRVEHRWNGGTWTNLGFTTNLTTELLSPASGIHEFNIYTVDVHGRESLPLYDSIEMGELAQFAPTGLLTNESHTVAAAADGTGFDLTGAGGTFELFSPIGTIVPADIVFSVHAETNVTATIDANGVYTITGLAADNGTVTFSAVWGGYAPILKTYTISKSKAGAAGSNGSPGVPAKLLFVSSDRQTVYYDSSGNLTPAAQTTTFKAQKQNTTAAVTWSVTDMNSVEQNVANCLSAATGDTVTMTAAQFAVACNGTNGCVVKGTVTDGATLIDQISVIKVGQGAAGTNGTNGTNGSNGLNNAQVFLFQRGTTAPALPSAVATYTFATGVLTGQNNGWVQTIPVANGQPLWVTAATASSATATDTIAATEWAAATTMAQDGAAGSSGTNGLNSATVFLYQRAATAPAVPSVTTTYTFATGILAAINNGWSQTVPSANGQPLYITTATALGSGATDTIATGEWAAPTIMAQDGATGASGLHNAQVFLYQRSAAAPAVPSVTTTYTFATGVLTGQNNGWSTTVPAANGNPLYVTAAVASATTATDTINASEWASPVIMAQDGTAGTNGSAGTNGTNGINVATVFLYQRAAAAPTVPSVTTTYTFATGVLSAINNGWSQSVPASNGQPCYVTTATALNSAGGTTDTIGASEWAAPSILVKDGAAGLGTNLVVNSDFRRGLYGFETGSGSTDGYALTVGLNTNPAYSGVRNVLQASLNTGGVAWNQNAQGTNYADFACTSSTWLPPGGLATLQTYGMPVKNGDLIYGRCLAASTNCNFTLYILLFDKNGVLLVAPSYAGALNGGGANGDPANFNVVGNVCLINQPGAAWASLMFRMFANGGANPTVFITEPAMGQLAPGQTVMPPYQSGANDPLADQTSNITGPATITINADYTGTVPAASLPFNQQYALMVNGVDQTASATWSVAVNSGTMAASVSAGVLSLNTTGSPAAITAGSVTLTAVYGGSTRTFVVKLTKVNGPQPAATGNATSVSQPISTPTSTTMTACGPELDVKTGSAGQVVLSADYTFSASNGANSVTMQWYRWNGSAFVALGSPVSANYAKYGDPVEFTCSYTATGLTANGTTAERFQLYMKESNVTAQVGGSGTMDATGS